MSVGSVASGSFRGFTPVNRLPVDPALRALADRILLLCKNNVVELWVDKQLAFTMLSREETLQTVRIDRYSDQLPRDWKEQLQCILDIRSSNLSKSCSRASIDSYDPYGGAYEK